MSEYPIPEDLRVDYEWACRCANIDEDSRTEKLLIERIAKQDAEIERLKQTLARFQSERPELGDLSFREQLRSELIISGLKASEENASLKDQVERLSAPVSDEEKAQFALHYVRLVQPDRQEPAMLVQNVNRFIASRAAKEKP